MFYGMSHALKATDLDNLIGFEEASMCEQFDALESKDLNN